MEKGRRSGVDYVEKVCRGPLRAMLNNNPNAQLMEDGAPIHRSKVATEWRKENGVTKLDWSAQSPDLNPIENVWRQMKLKVRKHSPPIQTLPAFRKSLRVAWNDIDEATYMTFIESLPERMAAVVAAKGGSTKW